MNIVFATSDLYSLLALVTIKSLLQNNVDIDEINIYYIGNNLSKEHKINISKIVNEYERKIIFLDMPENLSSIGGLLRKDSIVYSYCYMSKILPVEVDKVLLIESDVLVRGNLEELYNLDISNYYLAAADDMQSKWYKKKLGIKKDSPYFNSGIMLLNLKKWREDNIVEKFDMVISENKHKFFYEVQDEMNYVFEDGVLIFSPKFNCTTSLLVFNYKNMLKYRKPSTYCSKADFEEAINNPVIVHFTTNQIIQSRPWIQNCEHKFEKEYLSIMKTTIIADMELWPNKRKKFTRLIHFIYSHISKGLVARIVGFIHSYLYPKFLYKFILRSKT